MSRFKQDPTAQKALSQTVKLADVKSGDYDTVFYVGEGFVGCSRQGFAARREGGSHFERAGDPAVYWVRTLKTKGYLCRARKQQS